MSLLRTYKQLWNWRNYSFQLVLGAEVLIPEIVEKTSQNYLRMEHLKAQLKVLSDSIVQHKS